MLDDSYEHPRKVVHRPLHPPRDSTPGEGIYLALWVDWCTRNPREWRHIFETAGPVRQRAASVAASFMVFMGCNGGASFTHMADEYAARKEFGYSRQMAYLAAWAVYNKRCHGVNNGLRCSEFMLAREYPIDERPLSGRGVVWSRVPDVTQEDNDILESMVCWWASPTARAMREVAEPAIESKKRMLLAISCGQL